MSTRCIIHLVVVRVNEQITLMQGSPSVGCPFSTHISSHPKSSRILSFQYWQTFRFGDLELLFMTSLIALSAVFVLVTALSKVFANEIVSARHPRSGSEARVQNLFNFQSLSRTVRGRQKNVSRHEMPVSVRAFTDQDIAGTYKIDDSPASGCPSSLSFADVPLEPFSEDGLQGFKYPYSGVRYNGESCSSEQGELLLLQSSKLSRNLAEGAPSISRLSEIINQTDVLLILNQQGISCGQFEYDAGISFGILDTSIVSIPFAAGRLASVDLPPGQKLLMYQESAESGCVLQNLLGERVDVRKPTRRRTSGLSTNVKVWIGVGAFFGTTGLVVAFASFAVSRRKRQSREAA